jgi:dihydrofolate reductase
MLLYSSSLSLDGYIAGPDGDFSWSVPDDELHRFHNDRVRGLDQHLLGRRLYETMLYWERPDENWDATARDFAEIWQALPKVVFSRTLDAVEGNARLARGTIADELADDKVVEIGGATLAADAIDLIDEFHMFVCPVIIGGGTPYFPPGAPRIDLELVETRTFGSRVTYLRYRRDRGDG